ncbi:zeta toxin family protein [Ramlibacter albus]|uniref:Zeta toxin family protein n=1 Tax=Ramlibacter albus TaxID=2079448 RepID=A0A923S336_9BURK|nr:zeta toxin family protein [Ramlibacter albus]
MDQPKIIIIAGPNGAGKTTFAREFLLREGDCRQFVNADLIAAGLSPFAPEKAAVRAGRLMLQAIDEHVARRESFALETTLSGLGYARQMAGWRGAGYRVDLHFLSIPAVEECIRRVARRVQQGGHDIPEDVIRRRFTSGLRLFETVYRDLADAWFFYDNSGDTPQVLDWKDPMEPRNLLREHQPAYAGLPPDAPESVRGAYAALLRAAQRAREVARQTGTKLVIYDNGEVLELDPDDERLRS